VLLDAWPAVHTAVPEARPQVVSDADRSPQAGVEFLGAIDDARKRTFLGQTAVLCTPNLSGESFGIVLVEGMASQCAVVASTLPAFVNVLGDEGILVPPGDSSGLAQMLIRLLRDPDRIERLGSGARARSHRFDRGPVLDGYLRAYQDAVAAHSSRGPGQAAGS
jgi:phosphatidylinositol alpha-mannosyltransferase